MILASISECMTKDFAILKPDMPVAEASAKLIKKSLLGGPVLDSEGLLSGWISDKECLHCTLQVVYHNTRVATVGDVMQTDVVTVSLNSEPLDVAQKMLAGGATTYPVVDDSNKVVGVLTRRDILKMLDKKLNEMA